MDAAGKGSVKTSVQVPVKGIKYKSPVKEPVIKDVRGEKVACWIKEVIVHLKKKKKYSWGMETLDGSQNYKI